MPWWGYCLIPAVLWSVSNLVDQHLSRKYFAGDAGSLMATIGLFSTLSGTIILFFADGLSDLTLPQITISVGLGALLFFSLIFYIKALQISESRVVVPLFQITPIFVSILAWVFLGETLSLTAILAIGIIIIGAIGLVYDFGKIRFNTETLFFMMLTCLGSAIFAVASRYFISDEINWLLFAGLVVIGHGVFGLVYFVISPKKIMTTINVFKKSSLGILIFFALMEITARGAMLFYQKALSLAPATAYAQTFLTGVKPIIIFGLTFLFALITPATIAKLERGPTLYLNIASIIFMTYGLYLLLIVA